MFIRYCLVILLQILFTWNTFSQCTGTCNTYDIDLTTSPTYTTPPIQRNGSCCGITGTRCLRFNITIPLGTQQISFSSLSGADPTGSGQSTVNCGPISAGVGNLCVPTGASQVCIVYCKPGANTTQYQIGAITNAFLTGNVELGQGCAAATITATGYLPGQVTINSVFPGTLGQYNSLINFNAATNTGTVSWQPGLPQNIGFVAIGNTGGTCGNNIQTDTLWATFYPPFNVQISAIPEICDEDTIQVLTAVPTGGKPPYTINWNTGSTNQTILVGPGFYQVFVNDQLDCSDAVDAFYVVCDSDALAVKLAYLDTECEGKFAKIRWGTYSETNSSHFKVRKSKDGLSFHDVATVPSQGFSNQLVRYDWLDPNESRQLNYYQLIEYDNNGEGSVLGYTKSECFNLENRLKIFPNPIASDFLHLQIYYPNFTDDFVEIRVIDIHSKIHILNKVYMTQGEHIVELDVSKLNNGVYYLSINNSRININASFVKLSL